MKVTPALISKFRSSPGAFRDALLIDADAGPRPFGEVCDDWQRVDLESVDPAWLRMSGVGGGGGPSRAWLERPRGHSKTSDIGVMALWALAFSVRQVSGVVAATDREQAKLVRHAVDRLLRLNPWLGEAVNIGRDFVTNTRTGSRLEVVSSDAPGSYGRIPDFCICDELCHWPSRDLWDSLLSAAAKREHCVLAVISNAGFMESWQFDLREAVMRDPAWYFHSLDGPQASWIRPELLEEQRRLLPEPVFRRLWLNEWSSGSGDALQSADVVAAVTQAGPMRHERGWRFVGGLDLGISRDRSALAVVGRHVGWLETRESSAPAMPTALSALIDLGLAKPQWQGPDEMETIRHEGTHRFRLANVRSWKPPRRGKVNLAAVEHAVLDADREYGLDGVFYDPHQAEHMAQRLRRAGVRMIPMNPTAGNNQAMATALLESFSSRIVDVYDAGEGQLLLKQLQAMRIIERANNSFRLSSPRNKHGHGDLATAFCLALAGAQRIRVTPTLNRELLHSGIDFADLDFNEFEPVGHSSFDDPFREL